MPFHIPLVEYLAPEWAEAYRRYFLRADIFQANVAIALWQIPNLIFAYSDFAIFGTSALFYELLLARVATVIFSVLVILINSRIRNVRYFDLSCFVYGLALAFWLFGINLTRPSNYIGYILIDILAILTFYLLVPIHVIFRVSVGIVITALDLFILHNFRVGVDALTSQVTWTSLVFANAMGIVFAIRSELYRYRQFEAQKELERLAATDALTGILNRRKFFQEAEKEFTRFRRYDGELALVLLDVDEFKNINDRFGHPAGDAVLKSLGGALDKQKRNSDVFGRIGGDEFALLLPETGLARACQLGERFRTLCEGLRPSVGPDTIRITVSLGATETLKTDVSFDDLLHRADAALYQAKAKGRNWLETG
jgi:diguanylate cyclase (GGDEF)-like protein